MTRLVQIAVVGQGRRIESKRGRKRDENRGRVHREEEEQLDEIGAN